MVESAPDYLQPFIGFRSWVIRSRRRGFKKEWYLAGPHTKEEWVPGVNQAVCAPGPEVRRAPEDLGEHQAPHPDCVCGLYAYRRNREHRADEQTLQGAVKMWGRIEVHPDGARAELAEPIAIAPPGNEVFRAHKRDLTICLIILAGVAVSGFGIWLLPLSGVLTGLSLGLIGAVAMIALGVIGWGFYDFWVGRFYRLDKILPELTSRYGLEVVASEKLEEHSLSQGAFLPSFEEEKPETETYRFCHYQPYSPLTVIETSLYNRFLSFAPLIQIKPLERPSNPWGYEMVKPEEVEYQAVVLPPERDYNQALAALIGAPLLFSPLAYFCLTAGELAPTIAGGFIVGLELFMIGLMGVKLRGARAWWRACSRARQVAKKLGVGTVRF